MLAVCILLAVEGVRLMSLGAGFFWRVMRLEPTSRSREIQAPFKSKSLPSLGVTAKQNTFGH